MQRGQGRLEAKMALRADKMGGRVGQQKRRAEGKTKQIQSPGFDKRYRKKMDGTVVKRDA
jgi:hypothetical protein